MSISKRLRFEILRRDSFTCHYCGITTVQAELEVDHVIPEALGGSDDPSNLVTACEPCNSGKSATPIDAPVVAAVSDDARRWAAAYAYVVACEDSQRRSIETTVDEVGAKWETWRSGAHRVPRPPTWRQSVRVWIANGVSTFTMTDLIERAMLSRAPAKDKWTYYCGCVWTTHKRNVARTAEFLDSYNDIGTDVLVDIFTLSDIASETPL
jgi:HNH endonuclease